MKKFNFRLERVLEFRKLEEDWAKNDYVARRIERVDAELAVETIKDKRRDMLTQPMRSLDERRAVELLLESLDDEERGQMAVISVLHDEEAKALEAWTVKRQEVEALEKMKDKAYAVWLYDLNREEQSELDEWGSQQRKEA